MAKEYPRKIIIKATRNDKNPPYFVDFAMYEGGQKTDSLMFDKSKEQGMEVEDDHNIIFELQNEEGVNLEFVRSKADVLWAQTSEDGQKGKCPTKRVGLDQFKVVKKVEPLKLQVMNKNRCEEKLAFAINFIRTGYDENNPANFIPYDPIVDNRNGGVKRQRQISLLSIALLTVGTVAVVAAAVTLMSR